MVLPEASEDSSNFWQLRELTMELKRQGKNLPLLSPLDISITKVFSSQQRDICLNQTWSVVSCDRKVGRMREKKVKQKKSKTKRGHITNFYFNSTALLSIMAYNFSHQVFLAQ